MKLILIILIAFLPVLGFSQSVQGNSPGWSNQVSDENSLSAELKIYPNPCKDIKLTVEFVSREISEIRITNITGREVLSKIFSSPENKKEILLTDIPSGIYIVRIKTTDDRQIAKKLMVSKN